MPRYTPDLEAQAYKLEYIWKYGDRCCGFFAKQFLNIFFY